MVSGNTRVVQVTNIAPQATKDQMQTLFGYLGKIEDIRLYPTIRDVSCPVQSRICYIKFVDTNTVGIAQHMTNTVFIDRALIVIPVQNGDIPDEYYALEMTRNGTIVPGFNVNEPKLPPHVTTCFQGTGNDQVIVTTDPQLDINGLMPYPPLPYNYDSIKVEETRRTVIIRNIDPETPLEEIIEFFNKEAGEVKYIRGCEKDDIKFFLVEFTDQPTVIKALLMEGKEFKGKGIAVEHSTQSIVKPQAKSNEAAQKEIEEAMSRFKEAQNMINASIEPVIGMLTKDKRSSRRSRSRSRGRRRRSRSRSRRSRSRRRRSSSRSRKSRSRDRRKRSKSRSRKRSRSRSRRSTSRRSRSKRSRSRSRRRSSKHRSKERDSRSRARSHEKDRKPSRDGSKDRKRDRRSKDRDREKDARSKENKSRESKDKKIDKESSLDISGDKRRTRSRSRSRRSRSRDRKRDPRERRRSRSKNRRRTPSPRSSRKRTRSRSRDRKKDKKDIKRDRKDRSRSRSKVPRNYDEEEKGFDSEKDKRDADSTHEKESSEKSDNMDISNSP